MIGTAELRKDREIYGNGREEIGKVRYCPKQNRSVSRRDFLKSSAAATALAAMLPAQVKRACAKSKSIDEFVNYDALGMAELIKTGEISQIEAVDITIRRIEAIEPLINAITTPTFERAYEKAETISKNSTFAGMPILIKDMIDVGGVRRTDGSRMMLTNIPKENVKYIDGIEAAGMNIIGMTNVPEFAQLGIATNNTAFGLTKNPWDLSKSTLGSSGGAGAAVASGMVPLAHGTDGGGSNRLPPCTQGVFGIKPSKARMLPGEAGGAHGPFKTNQAICRTVRDSAALFSHTEDPDGPFPAIGLVERPSKTRLKIGYAASIKGGAKVEYAVRSAQENVVELIKNLGHEVVEIDIPVTQDEFFINFNGAFLGQFGALTERAKAITGMSAAQSGLLDPFTVNLIEYGASITPEQQAAGLAYLSTVPNLYAKTFEQVDLILSPVMPLVSLPGDTLTPTTKVNEATLAILENNLGYTASVNVSGHCAMSVPLNWDPESGMPIGSMFQAATGNDRMLYELAFELEAARPWKDRWAPYSIKNIPV
ncbi:MAG: amidase [Nisaea sp.]|uniref:amidase n=1 Tax=Nisaea sp. TaxID=2024842 RepID=UPI0032637156